MSVLCRLQLPTFDLAHVVAAYNQRHWLKRRQSSSFAYLPFRKTYQTNFNNLIANVNAVLNALPEGNDALPHGLVLMLFEQCEELLSYLQLVEKAKRWPWILPHSIYQAYKQYCSQQLTPMLLQIQAILRQQINLRLRVWAASATRYSANLSTVQRLSLHKYLNHSVGSNTDSFQRNRVADPLKSSQFYGFINRVAASGSRVMWLRFGQLALSSKSSGFELVAAHYKQTMMLVPQPLVTLTPLCLSWWASLFPWLCQGERLRYRLIRSYQLQLAELQHLPDLDNTRINWHEPTEVLALWQCLQRKRMHLNTIKRVLSAKPCRGWSRLFYTKTHRFLQTFNAIILAREDEIMHCQQMASERVASQLQQSYNSTILETHTVLGLFAQLKQQVASLKQQQQASSLTLPQRQQLQRVLTRLDNVLLQSQRKNTLLQTVHAINQGDESSALSLQTLNAVLETYQQNKEQITWSKRVCQQAAFSMSLQLERKLKQRPIATQFILCADCLVNYASLSLKTSKLKRLVLRLFYDYLIDKKPESLAPVLRQLGKQHEFLGQAISVYLDDLTKLRQKNPMAYKCKRASLEKALRRQLQRDCLQKDVACLQAGVFKCIQQWSMTSANDQIFAAVKQVTQQAIAKQARQLSDIRSELTPAQQTLVGLRPARGGNMPVLLTLLNLIIMAHYCLFYSQKRQGSAKALEQLRRQLYWVLSSHDLTKHMPGLRLNKHKTRHLFSAPSL